jgi:hypothetical protein
MFTEAFKSDHALAGAPGGSHRHNAACNAALAARGKGQDDPVPDQNARLGLLSLALGWLDEDRTAVERGLAVASPADRFRIVAMLNHWKNDPDLAGLRTARLVKLLPASQQNDCAAFWAKIDAMLAAATGKHP